jgi:sec-independent protein translocase protein TatA
VNLQAPELLIILAVVMLLFGAKKLPELAKSLGQAKKEFQAGTDESAAAPSPQTAPTPDDTTS